MTLRSPDTLNRCSCQPTDASRPVARNFSAGAGWRLRSGRRFARHVHCDRGVLRVCEDLYDLHFYSRVLVVSLGKAAHTMVEALAHKSESSLEGIVATSVEPAAQVRGFRYFLGGHPTPNAGVDSGGECGAEVSRSRNRPQRWSFSCSAAEDRRLSKSPSTTKFLSAISSQPIARWCIRERRSPKSTPSASIFPQ